MPDIEELKKELLRVQLEQDIKQRNRRSTLTQNNALKFMDYFNIAIETGIDVCIKYTDWMQIRPGSLYKNVLDGLKWLILHGTDEEKVKYGMFRARVSFQMSDNIEEGIWIRFRGDGRTVKPKGVMLVEAPPNCSWQEALHEFFSNAPAGTKFNMDRLNLSLDQKIDIENLFNSVNEHRGNDKIVFKVTTDSIKAVK